MKLTRRTFLKFLAGGAAGLLLTPLPWRGVAKFAALSQPADHPLPTGKQEFKHTVSNLCPAKSPHKSRLSNGHPVQALPWPERPLGGGGISSLAAGEVLVIDTGMVTAKVTDSAGNTLRNGLPCLEELNFPVLRRGVNEVEIAVEGSAVFTELHIQAKSRWR